MTQFFDETCQVSDYNMNICKYEPFEFPHADFSPKNTHCSFTRVKPVIHNSPVISSKMTELPRYKQILVSPTPVVAPILEPKEKFSWKIPTTPAPIEKQSNLNKPKNKVRKMSCNQENSKKEDMKKDMKKDMNMTGWETVTHVKPKKPRMPPACRFGDQCRLVYKQGNIWFNTRYDRVCNFCHPNEEVNNYEKRIRELPSDQPPPPKDITALVKPQAVVRIPKELASKAVNQALTRDHKNIKIEYK
jgi:hypothetical protein